MTNAETAAHLREYVKTPHRLFSWPTDACGYDQHIKFVNHRDSAWPEYDGQTFEDFVLRYAERLEVGS